MTSNMTYENLLGTCSNFDAYLLAVAKKFDDNLWAKSQTENTIKAYEHYLITLSNGIHSQEAIERIDNIKNRKKEERAENARQKTLQKQLKLDEDLWLEAKEKNTIESYEYYLNTLPNGIHKQEAIEHIKNIKSRKKEERAENERQKALQKHEREKQLRFDEDLWLEVTEKNTIESYEKYLNALPNGIHGQMAIKRIEQIKSNAIFIFGMLVSLVISSLTGLSLFDGVISWIVFSILTSFMLFGFLVILIAKLEEIFSIDIGLFLAKHLPPAVLTFCEASPPDRGNRQ
ncbi:hypothetical protein [Alishewanella longhuensis]